MCLETLKSTTPFLILVWKVRRMKSECFVCLVRWLVDGWPGTENKNEKTMSEKLVKKTCTTLHRNGTNQIHLLEDRTLPMNSLTSSLLRFILGSGSSS